MSKFRFYHPYKVAPRNDRMAEKTQKITFVCSVSARFEELAGFSAVFQPVSMKTGLDFADVVTRGFDACYSPLK